MTKTNKNQRVRYPENMVDAIKFPISTVSFCPNHFRRVWSGVVMMEDSL